MMELVGGGLHAAMGWMYFGMILCLKSNAVLAFGSFITEYIETN